MIHRGISACLTLHLVRVLLRAGDLRAPGRVDSVARLAKPTGQRPIAIHPKSGGGCKGNGQHIGAAADKALMIRNLFLREDGDTVVPRAGLFPRWLAKSGPLSFGPTLTPFGSVTIRIELDSPGKRFMKTAAEWRGTSPEIDAQFPGCSRVTVVPPREEFHIQADA